MGPTPNENQLPCQTLVACLIVWLKCIQLLKDTPVVAMASWAQADAVQLDGG